MIASTLRTETPVRRRLLVAASIVLFLTSLFPASSGPLAPRGVLGANPASVTIAGSLQSELGCAGDWDPACAATHLAYDGNDDVWQGQWAVPAGAHEYKAALNDSWTENYGAFATRDGYNISLVGGQSVKFYYSHQTHWITDNVNSVIAVAPGSFQSELGCSGDWDPGCLRSWLQDPDGDGIYAFETTVLPPGNYEAKVALNESWDVNYGQGGVQNGANIAFSVQNPSTVEFSYDALSHVPSITVTSFGPAPDNNVEWDGLRHDSRDTLYRAPGGAVPAGTPVTLRFRTFHNDVTSVKVRTYSLNAGAQELLPMTLAASDISCYEAALAALTCDFWEATLPGAVPDNIWYRFVVTDGIDTDYYADNTAALDGGLGVTTDDAVDRSWALMVHVPGFEAPAWAQDAVIYQIFPDRFRNGRKDNDPKTGDVRYDDPVIKLGWGVLPEGYCRNYADGNTNCPWRFDTTPPDWSPTKEGPRGRDYHGGDLKGVDQQLDYLATLGVTAIYFNPIFDAGSNHSYDTQDYYRIDPYFGTQKDWDNLVKHANERGIRVILDGVFNHLSSDSPLFDRYHHYATVGACESSTSPYRSWFTFHDVPPGTGTCASSTGVADSATYDGWFGFDSIPVVTKTLPEVQAYFLTAPDSVAKHWLNSGASGWRLDVSGDSSFPTGYWESFRSVTRALDPDSLSISETWQKDSTLLRMLRGDRLDTTMNYRLRDAIIGLLAPGPFDSKGFGDSGRIISTSEFANRVASIREDYPDAAYYSLMNLLDSHDTERLLWTLTPGAETTADKETNATNLDAGKLRVRLASLIQFAMPGAPTVYYGDEVGMTGDDDPDDRRTYPWADLGGSPDLSMLSHYQTLTGLRNTLPVLRNGDIRFLLSDSAAETLAFARSNADHAAIVAINRSGTTKTLEIPVAGFLAGGTVLARTYGVGVVAAGSVTVAGGILEVTLPALSGLLLATGPIDLAPPAAPANLHVTNEGNGQVSVAWDAVPGAAGYDVYASPLSGGGFIKQNADPVGGLTFTVTGLRNAATTFIVVRALDAAGNASAPSNEAEGMPHLVIGWANLQWPPSMTHTISAIDRTDTAYGQVWIDGATSGPGATPGLWAQLGFGPAGSNP
ncbi:MAG TPA: alpha-amylase family glycosyl hydrolase, partial [Candidatus Sulfomarinibacteraceae bacterium]|nr:alpha-amylase family glycosyl hydrolase [Candidatus Sulfomarinibacteraceae bacterium]